MILDEKTLLHPPPPYLPSPSPLNPSRIGSDNGQASTSSTSLNVGSNNPYADYLNARHTGTRRRQCSFSSLPSHLLLHIIYCTFPLENGRFEGEDKMVRQRETLHWLERSLRLVNRELYIACMHILRSTYLPTYDSLVRPPYSSDPFPSSSSVPFAATQSRCLSSPTNLTQPSSSSRSPYSSSSSRSRLNTTSNLFPQHRELRTLDLFIAVLAHEDLLLDSTSLHLPRHEAYKDIFDFMQPRSRLEDLVAKEGIRARVVVDETVVPPTPTTPRSFDTDDQGDLWEKKKTILNDTEGDIYSASRRSTLSSSLSIPSLRKPLKKSKSSFSLFFFSKGKGKAEAPSRPLPSPPVQTTREITPLLFSSLSISFNQRKVALMYTPLPPSSSSKSSLTVTGTSSVYGGSTYGALSVSHNARQGRKRAIAEVERGKDEALEVTAKKLVRCLKEWLEDGGEV